MMMQRNTQKVSKNKFIKGLLDDVTAMEYMLDNDWFENDIIRIGAEQEIVLIDRDTYRPSLKGPEILEKAHVHPWLVGELAKFNLELNLEPQVFEGSCLAKMEHELKTNLNTLREYLHAENIDYLLTGILPTLHKYHLHYDNLTPNPRYTQLMSALTGELSGNKFQLRLTGIDELLVRHDSPLMEACNTSFQVHLQVRPQDFVRFYNYALALTAPCISLAANSPVVFSKRLWHETRIALFQQAIDTRRTLDHMRQISPRVNLGTKWMDESITEIFKEDIVRFRTLMYADVAENSLEKLQAQKVPKLKCLQLHNSTVYRWNRPCYGISDTGKPHLRIENRVFPSGPTILDEMSNAAFWLGAMQGMANRYEDIRDHISFEDIRDNFGKSAQYGIDSEFTWIDDEKIPVSDLIIRDLIPLAREGLESMQVDTKDIDRYLGTIHDRMNRHMNGARWILRSYTKLKKEATTPDEALSNLTAAIYKNQNTDSDYPVHQWEEPDIEDLKEYHAHEIRVSNLMSTDLFTTRSKDLVILVAKLMKWRKLTYMPVENKRGRLVGLVSAQDLMDRLAEETRQKIPKELLVKDVMIRNPVTITPDKKIKAAIRLMKNNEVGCLPVTKDGELLGIITRSDLIKVSNRILGQ